MTEAYNDYTSILKQNLESDETFFQYWKSEEKVRIQEDSFNEIVSKNEELERLIKETKESVEGGDGIEDASYAMYLAGKAELWMKMAENAEPNQQALTRCNTIYQNCNDMTEEEFDHYILKEDRGMRVFNGIYTKAKLYLETITLQVKLLSNLKDKSQMNTLTFEI